MIVTVAVRSLPVSLGEVISETFFRPRLPEEGDAVNQSASEEMLQSARDEMVILVSPPVPFRIGVSDERGDTVRMAFGFFSGAIETVLD